MGPQKNFDDEISNKTSKIKSATFNDSHKNSKMSKEKNMTSEEYETMINKPFLQRKDIKWFNLFFLAVLHMVALYGFFTFPYLTKKLTFLWGETILIFFF